MTTRGLRTAATVRRRRKGRGRSPSFVLQAVILPEELVQRVRRAAPEAAGDFNAVVEMALEDFATKREAELEREMDGTSRPDDERW